MTTGEQMVRVGEVELFVREQGTGSPLLLVHGVGPDARGWSPTFEELARTHRVVAYDRPGYGRSANAAPAGGWSEQGEDAAMLLRKLDATPATIVGWSGGGYVALHLAAEHPDLVSGVVLAETGIPYPPTATVSYLFMLVRAQLTRRLRGERAATESFYRWALSEGDRVSTWDRPEYPEERRQRGLENASAVWGDFSPRGRPNLSRDQLAKVRCPVTLILGDRGRPWFRRSAEALAKALPDSRIETIQGTNHAFTFHRPVEFAEAIRSAAAGGRQ